jgi:Xaa-Pro aminopeptidase
LKSDLDRLLSQRDYAALLVTGGAAHNPPMYYLANGAKVTESTILVKKRDEAPILFANSMERDEAAKSGLQVIDLKTFHLPELIHEENGNRLRAMARLYGKILAEAGVQGKVAVFGQRDQGAALQLLTAIEELNPHIQLIGEFDHTVFDLATATKDADEVKRIRAVGRKTMKVVAGTEEFLTSHRAKNGYLVKKDGARLTVGDVKRRINQLLAEQGIVDAEGGTIFATGRDAAVPHSRGTDRAPIALGQTIVYDIFPAEPGGGYFFDFTRTWCIGYAPPEVERIYQDVLDVFKAVTTAMKPGGLCRAYQQMACGLLEARGHPTIQSNPQTTSGYVHSLGHGVGLRIHESPRFSDVAGNPDRLQPGVVVTIEPGLYYPDRDLGIRIEDCLWLNPETLKFETLANYSKELVLPVKSQKSQLPNPKSQPGKTRVKSKSRSKHH